MAFLRVFWQRAFWVSMLCAGIPFLFGACQPDTPESNQSAEVTLSQEAVLYPLAIHTDQGTHLFRVEAARNRHEMAMGLMYRRTLADDAGMVFILPKTEIVNFWMKNTYIPLDMIFINTQGKIVHIHPMAKPFDETPIPSVKPAAYVLEIAGGQAAHRGIHIGDMIETSLFAVTE